MSSDLFAELTAPNGVKFTQPLGLFINNEFVAAKSGTRIAAISPTDETEIVEVQAGGAEDIDEAVKAARAAFPAWREVPPTKRGALLLKLADLVEQHKDVLSAIETWNNGMPISRGADIGELTAVSRFYAGFADKVYGQVIETRPGQLCYTIREPVGVCGQIVPWNYPLGMASWKFAPALAAGNCIILKPSEQTPLSIMYIASLFKEAGFPPGVVNIVNGYGKEAGAALAGHMNVDKIAFTGSTGTGKLIMKLAANNLKEITLETGGKSPLIVFGDANLESAVKWGHYGIMANAGQICTANSRILVHESVYHEYVELFKKKIKATSIMGDPFDEKTFHGPQVSEAQYNQVLSYIEIGKNEGATLSHGGGGHKDPAGKGYFINPTVFTDVKDDMKIYREEIFGPVVVISPFSTEAEAITRANDSTYGLGASLFTKDLSRAHLLARKIESGTVWINSSNDSDIRVPFGGLKQSGVGRECGEAGIQAYTTVKSILVTLD